MFNEKKGVPTSLVIEFILWLKRAQEAGIEVIGIPGNHDLQHDRLDSLPLQPIQILFETGLIKDVSFKLHFHEKHVDVAFVGIPYPHAKEIANYSKLPVPHPSVKGFLLAHCFATMSGGNYFQEPILPYPELAELPYDVFHFGHDHQDNGVKKIGEKYFINIGALARGSVSIENITRDVKCAIVEIGKGIATKVTQVKLSYKPASEVFDLVLRAQKQREATEIEAFVGSLSQDLEDATKDIDFKEKVNGLDLPVAVKNRVNNYIENAEKGDD